MFITLLIHNVFPKEHILFWNYNIIVSNLYMTKNLYTFEWDLRNTKRELLAERIKGSPLYIPRTAKRGGGSDSKMYLLHESCKVNHRCHTIIFKWKQIFLDNTIEKNLKPLFLSPVNYFGNTNILSKLNSYFQLVFPSDCFFELKFWLFEINTYMHLYNYHLTRGMLSKDIKYALCQCSIINLYFP